MFSSVVKFFDKLEDKVRAKLSRRPIIYTLIGGVAIVLFWKGVWETAELFPILFGPASIILSVIILLVTGLFVSFFIGDRILISGVTKEKKLAEKTEIEIREEESEIKNVETKLKRIEKEIHLIGGKRLVVKTHPRSKKKLKNGSKQKQRKS